MGEKKMEHTAHKTKWAKMLGKTSEKRKAKVCCDTHTQKKKIGNGKSEHCNNIEATKYK